jgi:hypothetical protein
MKRTVWLLLFGALALACAIDAPPPGGPVDETPPRVVGTFPVADSAGVDPGSEIGIVFSEKMSRSRVERMLSTSPEIEIGKVRWDGNTMFVQPAEPLHPDTTYLVTMEPGYRDFHKVTSKKEFLFAFATAAAIDSASISGRVYFRREPTRNGVVYCFVLPVDSGFTPESARPDREALTDDEGNYEIRYLSNSDVSYLVWAFEDKNNNRTFAPGDEAGLALEDTITLTPSTPFASGMDIWIVDPDEPASIAGVIADASAMDSFLVSVALFADSLGGRAAYLVSCDSTGGYAMNDVRGGTYLLQAFVDVVTDSVCGEFPCLDDTTMICSEPCALYPDTLFVEPGTEVVLDTLRLEPGGRRRE